MLLLFLLLKTVEIHVKLGGGEVQCLMMSLRLASNLVAVIYKKKEKKKKRLDFLISWLLKKPEYIISLVTPFSQQTMESRFTRSKERNWWSVWIEEMEHQNQSSSYCSLESHVWEKNVFILSILMVHFLFTIPSTDLSDGIEKLISMCLLCCCILLLQSTFLKLFWKEFLKCENY